MHCLDPTSRPQKPRLFYQVLALLSVSGSIKTLIRYHAEKVLETGILIEDISNFSHRTITCAGRLPEHSHQSSLCLPYVYTSDAICPHIPRILETLRLPIKKIGKNTYQHKKKLEAMTYRTRNKWKISSCHKPISFLVSHLV